MRGGGRLGMAALLGPACVGYHGARRETIAGRTRALVVGAGPIGFFCMQAVKAADGMSTHTVTLEETPAVLAVMDCGEFRG